MQDQLLLNLRDRVAMATGASGAESARTLAEVGRSGGRCARPVRAPARHSWRRWAERWTRRRRATPADSSSTAAATQRPNYCDIRSRTC